MVTGLAKLTCCQPLPVSLVKVAVASFTPLLVQRLAICVPVFALLYGALALGESITLWMLMCGAVIVLGTALSTGLLRPRALSGSRRPPG